jgi:8-oxo-dGTP pyrophosphatase MutT (NUDIX family)
MTVKVDADFIRAALAGPARAGIALEGTRPAAVLVPIRFEPEPVVSLVVRSRHLSEHAGEVAFPGGKPERGEALRDTAYREAEEEVGLVRGDLDELGVLTPVPVVTGLHMIHPFVAAITSGARPRAASGEVERVIETPALGWITGELRRQAFATEWRGNRFLMPQFPIDGALLYGATAIVFCELLIRIAEALRVDFPDAELVDTPPWARR